MGLGGGLSCFPVLSQPLSRTPSRVEGRVGRAGGQPGVLEFTLRETQIAEASRTWCEGIRVPAGAGAGAGAHETEASSHQLKGRLFISWEPREETGSGLSGDGSRNWKIAELSLSLSLSLF